MSKHDLQARPIAAAIDFCGQALLIGHWWPPFGGVSLSNLFKDCPQLLRLIVSQRVDIDLGEQVEGEFAGCVGEHFSGLVTVGI
jgi:hypothetical protein